MFGRRVQGDVAQGELILDGNSALEVGLGVAGFLLLAGSLTMAAISLDSGVPRPSFSVAAITSSALILGLRYLLDDRYRLDFKSRRVEFQRKILGWTQRFRVCAFSDIASVAVSSRQCANKNGLAWWEYGLSLVLKDGTLIPVLPPMFRDRTAVCEDGATLANSLAVRLHEGQPEQLLTVGTGPLGPEVTYKEHTVSNLAIVGVLAVLLVAPIAVAYAMSLTAR